MTENKAKGAQTPENTEKNREDVHEPQGAGITVSGISGTKTLRVGRVNKRPKDVVEDHSEAGAAAPASDTVAPSEPTVSGVPAAAVSKQVPVEKAEPVTASPSSEPARTESH